MSPDFKKRDFLLPKGCKNLIDVIARRGFGTAQRPPAPGQPTELLVSAPVLVADLAALLGQDPPKIVAELMKMGVFATMDQHLDFEAISKVVAHYGLTARKMPRKRPGSKGSQ
jgi:hypothetical protein